MLRQKCCFLMNFMKFSQWYTALIFMNFRTRLVYWIQQKTSKTHRFMDDTTKLRQKYFQFLWSTALWKKVKKCKKTVFKFTIGTQNAYIHRKFPQSCLQLAKPKISRFLPSTGSQFQDFCLLATGSLNAKVIKIRKKETKNKKKKQKNKKKQTNKKEEKNSFQIYDRYVKCIYPS